MPKDDPKETSEQKQKPKVPPKPPRRRNNLFANISEKPPMSADPLSKPRTSPRSIDVLGPVPRTADIFSRRSNEALFNGKPIPQPRKSKEKLTNPLDSIIRDNPSGGYVNEAFVEQSNRIQPPQPGFPGAVNDGHDSPSPRRDTIATNSAWQSGSRKTRSPPRRAQSGRDDGVARQRGVVARQFSTTDVEARPKAARPRRPVTAAQPNGYEKQVCI